jgi:hypothetical protein
MKIIGLGFAAALALAGCTTQTETTEQSMAPAAGPEATLTYPANNMGEFEAARMAADNHCYKEEDLRRAQYVDRTADEAHFECAAR